MAKNVNNLTLKFNPDQERARRHSGQFSSPSVMDPELPHFLAVTGSHRSRSGSFNPTILTTKTISPPDKVTMNRERSYSDVKASSQQSTLRRTPCTSPAQSNGSATEATDLETIQCFFPTGMVMDISVHPDDDIFQIKQFIISTATVNEQLPLRGCLNPDFNAYFLSYVSQQGVKVEVDNESKTLRELNPFLNILKFNMRTKDRAQYMFKRQVGQLIGIDLKKFDKMMSCEVNDFRWRMKVFANKLAQERRARLKESWRDRIMYQYPARLACNLSRKKSGVISVELSWDNHVETEINIDLTAEELLLYLGRQLGLDEDRCRLYCIKTIGEASFLLGSYKLSEYAFIQENPVPKLAILLWQSIDIDMANDSIYMSLEVDVLTELPPSPSAPPSPTRSLPRKTSLTSLSLSNLAATTPFNFSTILSCNLDKPFKISIESINYGTDAASFHKLELQVGLFHGGRLLCPLKSTTLLKGEEVNAAIEFDITVSNLPRMAKLCFGLYVIRKANVLQPISWVNANVFDYRAKLRKRDSLHMWRYSLNDAMPTYEMLSPLRTNISNPKTKDSTSIVLVVHNHDFNKIQYPSRLTYSISNFSNNSSGVSVSSMSPINENGNGWSRINKLYAQELTAIAQHDPLHVLTVQEKELIWKVREQCLDYYPHLLPRIIDCVDYANQQQVADLHKLIEVWPLLPPEKALQLFDYAYPDEHVRKFAVRCWRQASDDTVNCYLLQLAQSLKHESYFQCDLVEFLMERALNNQHVGHHFFWELKAEMTSPNVTLLYGLILEAYLAAAPEHVKVLELQLSFLEKCRSTQVNVQKMEIAIGRNHEKAKNRFIASTRSQFTSHHGHQRNFVNPLNPSQKCKRIVLDKCRIMNSKMRPQMLFFENVDASSFRSDLDQIGIMFKKGDDLRQDRLTLQLLSVMDRLWKEDEGLDLRLKSYNCMSTGVNEGLIEVVTQAETVCKIQMQQADKTRLKSTAALKKGLVLAWLKSHNPTHEAMKRAQIEFTRSCAGYSVATYILGIADRHNDNIMVRTNGQLFHIDFGHFLGNFKYKFGIKRERVPIVLPGEFVEVISVGDYGNDGNFDFFRKLCEQAFLAIRRRADLIISLLTLMISTGLPELNSEQDLNIVRTTLHLDQTSESEALEMFRKDFKESLRNQWTISLNWWVHMVNQLRSRGVK